MKNKSELKREFIKIMQIQFQVWGGTDNAYEVLQDTAYAVGHYIFELPSGFKLADFANECCAPVPEKVDP